MTKETNIKKIIGMGLQDDTARIEEANRKYFEAKKYKKLEEDLDMLIRWQTDHEGVGRKHFEAKKGTKIISAEIMKDSDKRINRNDEH